MIDFSNLVLDGLPDEPVAWALAYASVGIPVVPVRREKGKLMPCTAHGVKDATVDPTIIRKLWSGKHKHADILAAIPLELLVIDLDRKNGKDGYKAFERLTGLVVDALDTAMATSPSGGVHLYFYANGVRYRPFEDVLAPGIDFSCGSTDGRGAVLPGPRNGRLWTKPLSGPIMEAPAIFADFMRQKAAQNASGASQASAGSQPGSATHAFTGETPRARKALDAACKALAEALKGRLDATVGKHVPRVGSLAGAGELIPDMALDELLEAASRCPSADAKYIERIKRAFDLGLSNPAPRRTQAPRGGWAEHAMLDSRGEPLMNVANTLTAIRLTPEIEQALAYDELLCAAVLMTELPLVQGAKPVTGRTLPRPVTDEDVTRLQAWLQWNGLAKIGKEIVHQAVDAQSQERSFHKLREWLENRQWDGKPRLGKWLIDHLGAEDTPYHRDIGKMFLISMVARVFKPGCQSDYVLILQGPQGDLKSSACRVLAGEDYFADNLPDIRSKDANQYVRGLWLIELPELSAMSRSDVDAWKAFITRRKERYRPFYGRRETHEPRQCNFIGTTNRDEFLQDETGNRRMWPAKTGKIDLDALKADREQLFAEAVHCYRAGERWWPDQEFEKEHILPEQEARYVQDVWEPTVEKYLETLAADKIRVCDIATECLGFETSRISTADARRISRVLYRLGWKQPPRTGKGRHYHRPNTV
jgi:predicted P-loop ATPase